ncbi:MAG: hypothetical protein EVB11_00545 [Winogradskyella sp.]|nr:MAG: hypothetical protein EVB11_00545 [Winogradskyella sp.]
MNFSKSKHRLQSIRIIDAKKGVYFTAIALLFSVISVNAQSTPPTPPSPPTVKSSGTSYSISIDNDDDETLNSSVSISLSDDTYKFRASYHKSKNNGVKDILLEKLGENGLKISGNTYMWTNSENGDEVFECKLTNGRLRMYLDLDYTSDAFLEKIKAMGQDLKYYISGSSKEKEEAKKVARAKREMERAQRDLERAQRDLERSKRAAERAKKN